MLFLVEFSVLDPSFGLFFWTTVIFILVWLFLSRFFKNIAQALEDRENFIDDSISKAKDAEKALANIESAKQAKIKEAEEKSRDIISEAESIRKSKIAEGEQKANVRRGEILEAAKEERENRKKEMETDIQNAIGLNAIEIATKVLRKELEGKHEDFVKAEIEKLKSNKELVA